MIITHVHRKLKGVSIVESSWVPATIVSLLLCAVLGCAGQSQLESAVNEYRARLNRVLGISIPAAKWDDSLTSALAYPTVSALNVNIVPMNINLRDFYAIQDCELGRIVAERNTALGHSTNRKREISVRLLHETSKKGDFSTVVAFRILPHGASP